MTKEEVDRIGKGRVWTGAQAKELGLVDEIGGLSKALELAKNLAGIPLDEKIKITVWPKKSSFLAMFLGRKQSSIKLDLNPSLEKTFSTFILLEKEKIWALMPFWIAPQ